MPILRGYNFKAMKNLLKLFATLALVFTVTACGGPKVEPGQVVKIDYEGTFDDGTVFDTTKGKQPFAFLVGSGQVLPAFEKAITGMRQGSSKKVKLKPADAYGEADPKKQVELPKEKVLVGANANLKEGATIFVTRTFPDGRTAQAPVKITKITDKGVIVDYNHPLAGKTLTFNVKVLEIVAPQAPAAAPAAAH